MSDLFSYPLGNPVNIIKITVSKSGCLHSGHNSGRNVSNRRLRIGRDGHLDHSKTSEISKLVRNYGP